MRFKEYVEGKKIYCFCDMDGVLTDFHKHFFDEIGWNIDDIPEKESYKMVHDLSVEWWETMPWKKDGKELWDFLTNNFKNLHILSAPTKEPENKSRKGKITWLTENGFIDQLGMDRIHIANDKEKFVQQDGISILIDDTQKKIDKWRHAGGHGILHTDTSTTITELKNILSAL
jgi:dipeptidyl aminopeptidase/acylaminoacyl peptidase